MKKTPQESREGNQPPSNGAGINQSPSLSLRARPTASPQKRQSPQAPRTRLTPVAWLAHVDLSVEGWRAQGGRLGAASRSTNWWLGDWVRFGSARHGQRYDTASAVTGYDEQTLMNMVYVSARFEISRRRETVSWSHHAELAALEPELQEEWLNRAEQERFSVRTLRREVRQAQHPVAALASLTAETLAREPLAAASHNEMPTQCPRCGYALTVSAEVDRLAS
jgi:hypothetical protein